MKKFYLLLLAAIYSLGLFAAITDVEKLYFIGNAAPSGWDQGSAQQMTKQADGTWAWIGDLKAGDFKFLVNNTDWKNFITCAASNVDVENGTLQTVKVGEATKIVHYQTDAPKDYKFIMPEGTTGRFTIVLDLEAETMLIKEGGEIVEPEKPEITSLFLMGDATEAGMDVLKAIEMTNAGEGRFIWTGALNAGSFSFVNVKEDGKNINPEAGHSTSEMTNTKGVECALSFKQNDNTFAVAEAGEYTITVNLKTMYMAIDQSILAVDNLNIIGGALETNGEWGPGWPNYPMMAVEDEPGVYTISKNLYSKTDGSAAELKFRTGSSWDRGFVLASDEQKGVTPEVGKEYKMFYRAFNNNNVVGDNKFGVTAPGAFKFTFDLNTLILTVEEAGEIIFPVSDVNTLYVCGTSFSGAGSFIAMPKVEGEKGLFRYEGEVKAGDFTFYNKADLAENISPAMDTELAEGEIRLIYKRAGSPKFTVAENGSYVITVDLVNMQMNVEKSVESSNAWVESLVNAVSVQDNMITVSAVGTAVQTAALYDLSGRCLSRVSKLEGTCVLASQLSNGVYVVRLTVEGKEVVQKVMVK